MTLLENGKEHLVSQDKMKVMITCDHAQYIAVRQENQIKFIDVAKEWMYRWMMKNVHKIKIKLENIWIDLIMGIYAPYNQN